MKCFRRSTRLFASAGLVLVLATRSLTAGAGANTHGPVADAIVRAVQLRLGSAATVAVSSLDGVRLAQSTTTLIAVPEPSARLGGPVRFLLSDGQPGRPSQRIGEAVAWLEITAPVVQTTRPVARGERVMAADLQVTVSRLDRAPLRAQLSLDEVTGARATRDISAGTTLTRADVAPEPLVRAGDTVRAHARVAGIEVVGDMVAADSGGKDDVIRVVNTETKYAARARVTARGEVEVQHVR